MDINVSYVVKVIKYIDDSNSLRKKYLDNSAYELGESIPPKQLKKYADDLNVDVVVIPDKLFDKERSLVLEKEFKSLYTIAERKKIKFLKVVCGNNIKEYEQSLREVILDKDVDIIGISKARTVITPNLSYLFNIIYEYTVELKEQDKRIHLLGMDHPFELREAACCSCYGYRISQ